MFWNGATSANRLKILRTMAEETQEETARSLNISRSCLANYETGRRIPDASMIAEIAKHFQVDTLYFQGGNQEELQDRFLEKNQEFLQLMPHNGRLELRELSEEGRMALYCFYHFLLERWKYRKD